MKPLRDARLTRFTLILAKGGVLEKAYLSLRSIDTFPVNTPVETTQGYPMCVTVST